MTLRHPTYAEFRAAVPLVDWERIAFELDFSRKVWVYSRQPITLSSRIAGILFAVRLWCPDGTGSFAAGSYTWCWPWRWHRTYYARGMAHAQKRTPDPVTGGTPIPLGPKPPTFTAQQVRKLRRVLKSLKRSVRSVGGDSDTAQGDER